MFDTEYITGWNPGDRLVCVIVTDNENLVYSSYYYPNPSDLERMARLHNLPWGPFEELWNECIKKTNYHTLFIDAKKFRDEHGSASG